MDSNAAVFCGDNGDTPICNVSWAIDFLGSASNLAVVLPHESDTSGQL